MSLFFKVISSQMTSVLVVNPRKQEVEIVRVERGEKIVRNFPFEDITLMDKGSKKLKFAGSVSPFLDSVMYMASCFAVI